MVESKIDMKIKCLFEHPTGVYYEMKCCKPTKVLFNPSMHLYIYTHYIWNI